MLDDNLSTRKFKRTKQMLRTADSLILCECGFEILLVLNFKAMSKAIEDHAAEHAKKENNIAKAAFEEERIQNLLIVQVLDKAVNL